VDEVVIVSAVRTAIGRFGGGLAGFQAHDLATIVLKEAVNRAGIEPEEIDEVVFGHTGVNGESPNAARLAVLNAGYPVDLPAHGVERQCGSGLQAICDGVMQIQTGQSDIVVGGGTESMSNMEYYLTGARWGYRLNGGALYDRWERATEVMSSARFGRVASMPHTAANVGAELNISREEADQFAFRSQQNAKAAMEAGKFKDEIIPVMIPQRKGDPIPFEVDEHPRPETTLEGLAKLRPLVGDITAGNASGMNDGAAACVLMSEKNAEKRGLEPMGYVKAWTVDGVNPAVMGLGPVPAVTKLLKKTGLTLDDMDLIELNEAFAAQALGVLKQLNITDYTNLNVNGSGIAMGHPVGATGARIMVSTLYEMKRRNAHRALITMCIGGGQGIAAIVERK